MDIKDETIFKKIDGHSITSESLSQMAEIERGNEIEPYSEEMLLRCIKDMDNFVCCDHDRIVGFVTIHSCSRYFRDSLYIVNIQVLRPYWGRGIAKRLMYQAYQYYRQDYADKLVFLDVTKTNKAMMLYEKIGFQVMDLPSKNGSTDVVMAMPLSLLGESIEKFIGVDEI